MLSLYSALLTDPEREVKTVACSDLSKLCSFVGAAAFKPALLSQLKSLLADESPNVRSKLTKARYCRTRNFHHHRQPTIYPIQSCSCRHGS